MKLHSNNLSLLIILYCASLFTLVQPFLLGLLGDGATTFTNIALLLMMVGLFAMQAMQNGNYVIRSRYLWSYGLAILGVAANYLTHFSEVQHSQKYYAAVTFITISAIVSCKDFDGNPSLPRWLALPLAVYFLFVVLQQLVITNFGATGRASLDDNVVSNLNYLPIAGFLLATYFLAVGNRAAMLLTGLTVLFLMLLTQSRSAFLAIVSAMMFLNLKRSPGNVMVPLRIVAVLISAYFLVVVSGMQERFIGEIGANFTEETGRILILRDLTERYLRTPFIGAGFAVDEQIRYDPHSMFLELLLQGGVIGFVTMVPILAFGIRAANRAFGRSPLGSFAALGMVCLTVSAQFTGSLLLNLPLWLFLGLCLSLEKNRRPA